MKRHALPALFQTIGGVLLFGGLLLAFRFLPMLDWLAGMQQAIARLGPGGAALYPLAYALCNVLLLPGGVLSIGGGFFFGLRWGFVLVLSGNLLGAAIAFALGRGVGRRLVQKHLLTRPRWARLDRAIQREGWKIVMLSQLNPLFPTSLLNYLYGVTGVPFRSCMGWIALGQAPGLLLYVYLGTLGQFGINLWKGTSNPRPIEYVLWIGGGVFILITTFLLGRIALRLLREAAATDDADRLPPSASGSMLPGPAPEARVLANPQSSDPGKG